ncbi:MAG: hypothetical protein WAX37_02205 [Minisyncoccia bacterium]
MKSIDIECADCKGSGVRREPYLAKGLGFVCEKCHGSGKVTLRYKPFNKRRKRDDVDSVIPLSAGLNAIGLGTESGSRISYTEFLNGKMSPRTSKKVR